MRASTFANAITSAGDKEEEAQDNFISWSEKLREAAGLTHELVHQATERGIQMPVGDYVLSAENLHLRGGWSPRLVVRSKSSHAIFENENWTEGGGGTTYTLNPPPDIQEEILEAIREQAKQ